jgi:hypothetical protein
MPEHRTGRPNDPPVLVHLRGTHAELLRATCGSQEPLAPGAATKSGSDASRRRDVKLNYQARTRLGTMRIADEYTEMNPSGVRHGRIFGAFGWLNRTMSSPLWGKRLTVRSHRRQPGQHADRNRSADASLITLAICPTLPGKARASTTINC